MAVDDALIHRVLTDMGGWVLISQNDDAQWPFVRNEFVNRYRGFRERHQLPDYPRYLIGAAEGVFGKGAEGLAGIIEKILKDQGRPNAYISGREASGAYSAATGALVSTSSNEPPAASQPPAPNPSEQQPAQQDQGEGQWGALPPQAVAVGERREPPSWPKKP